MGKSFIEKAWDLFELLGGKYNMNTVVIKYQFAYPNQTTYDMILLLDFFNAFRQFMAESRVNTFRQKVFGWTLKVTRQPDFGHFSAEFKVTLR